MEKVTQVKLASLLFGVGSWITITGFWAELPLLIASLPEKWKLSSQLSFFIQAANIGPLVFWFCRRYRLCSEVTATHVQMVLGVISCLILVTAWDLTFHVFGSQRSILLFVSAFGLSLLDCTSSVTFLPFILPLALIQKSDEKTSDSSMARFNPIHLTPYLIGEGLSGFVPIVVATIQGVGESESCEVADVIEEGIRNQREGIGNQREGIRNQSEGIREQICAANETCSIAEGKLLKQPLFSPNVFFTSLLATLLLSWFAFFWLLYSKTAKTEYVPEEKESDMNAETECVPEEKESDMDEDSKVEKEKVGNKKYFILQGIIIYSCLSTFGIMPAIQSYSTLPYGGWSLHYTVILTGLAYPFGCFVAMLKHVTSLATICIWTFLGTLVSIFILVIAIMSPTPPLSSGFMTTFGLADQLIGGTIMIIAWTSYVIILSYVKTVITVIVSQERGEEALFTVGLFTQIGSVFGAGFMFLAINYFHWFHEC